MLKFSLDFNNWSCKVTHTAQSSTHLDPVKQLYELSSYIKLKVLKPSDPIQNLEGVLAAASA